MTNQFFSAEEYGINNVLLTYICDGATGSLPVSEDVFLPSVAYLEDGIITDTMFDSFLFLPAPNYVHANESNNDAGMASLDKNHWKNYITSELFVDGYNLDALNAATAKTKQALGKNDYKVSVFFTMFYPVRAVTSFGEVDGRNLNLSFLEDRRLAVKWMIDKCIAVFNEKGYEHLKIGGFYWFSEAINYNNNDPDILKVIGFAADYLRSKNYLSLWLPYFLSCNYENGRKIGFDIVAMQPNFFPSKDLPNVGGEERLYKTAELALKNDIAVEIELEKASEDAVTNTKLYYRVGLKTGYINGFHAFYMNRGPLVFHKIYTSDDEYIKSFYIDTYHFIKKNLDEDSIIVRL